MAGRSTTSAQAEPKAAPARRATKTAAKSSAATAAPTTSTPAAPAPANKATVKKTPAKKAPAKAVAAKTAAPRTTPARTATTRRRTATATAAKTTAAARAMPDHAAAEPTTPVAPAPAPAPAPTPETADSAAPAAAATPLPMADRVRANEAPWTATELRDLQADIETHVAQLRQEIETAEADILGLMRDGGDGSGDDQADAGAKTYEREQELAIANNARDLLEANERALERLADGSYGMCETCGEPIGKFRLQAAPRATLCVTCKQKQERR